MNNDDKEITVDNIHKHTINVVLVLGSVRENNFTAKALSIVLDELAKLPNITSTVIDPSVMNLPLPGVKSTSPDTVTLNEAFSKADGIIFSTPEYHGSFSSVVKLIIENLGFPSAMAGKPVALLGVAAGQIGAIKSLEHLRGVCSHVGSIVLPGPVSVANVQKVFDSKGNCLDESVEARLRKLAHNLVSYINKNVCPGLALEAMVRNREMHKAN